DETIGQFRHQRLAFVHGFDHAQIAQAAMAHFPGHERFGNDAENIPASRQDGIGDDAHESDIAAAIDESDAAFREFGASRLGRLSINSVAAAARSAEDAK